MALDESKSEPKGGWILYSVFRKSFPEKEMFRLLLLESIGVKAGICLFYMYSQAKNLSPFYESNKLINLSMEMKNN